MSGILVVTAPNRRNLGMYSVDKAAISFFFQVPDVSFSTLLDGYYRKAPYGNLPISDLPGSFDNFDMIVYWGDFTTSPWYGFKEYSYILARRRRISRLTGIQPPRSFAFRKWEKSFSPLRVSGECHSVGQNFQIDCSGAEAARFFRKQGFDAERHYKSFASVLSRDSVSASFQRKVRGQNESHTCDLAFLGHTLKKRDSRNARRIGLLLKRSELASATALTQLLHQEYTIIDLSEWLSADPRNISGSYERTTDIISECDAVVTDVYHLSINSLSLGVPVLCLGADDSSQVNAVSDFKKKVLFSDIGQSEAFIALESTDVSADQLFEVIRNKLQGLEDFYNAAFWINLHCFVDESRTRIARMLGV